MTTFSKWSFLVSVVVLLALYRTCNTQTVVLVCPTGWTQIGNRCYRLVVPKMLQADAMKTCNNWGAQLATIYGFEENLNIAQIVMATNVTRYWVDSSNLEDPRYGYWDINEPDATRGTCAYVDLVQSSQYKAGLSYASCYDSMSAVCEMYACLSGYFRCANNNCINRQWTCDGTNDCGDNSDETDCSSLCRTLITGQTSGQIRSASPYAANSDCQWVIEAPVGTRISLQFTAFATEFMLDEVQVWMGGKTLLTSTLLKRLSGSPTTSAFQFWPTLYSSNNYMIIVFRSDATNQLAGFSATWTAVTSLPGAGSTLQATTTMQTFTSPSYPAGLLPGLSETWIIRSRKWSVVQIKINSMMLCPGSTVTIFNGDNVYNQILATINPGNAVSGTYIVATTNAMMIQLKTQMWCQSTGFSIGYMEGCGGTLVMNNGYVASPGYGFGDYANFTVCQWKVQTPAGSFIKVHFDSLFNLDSRGDRLKLYDGSTNSSNLVYDITGTVAPQDFTSSNNTLFFIFTSNAIVSNAGFRAGFSIGCPDPLFNVNTQFTPNPYTLTLGSQIVVTCPVGYFLAEQPFLGMASVTLMCGVNGWNYFRSPQCHKVYCGEPPILDNGFIISSTGVEYQAQVTYGCYGGYNLGSVFSVTCQQDATWTTAPFCTPVQCPQQQLSIANGAVLIAGGDGVSFTSVLNYTCDTGYQINGTPLLVCQQDGTWSASPPTCIPRTCPVPLIANAAVVPFDFVTVNQQAFVSCNSGFALAGTGLQFATITCLGTLQFDSIPSCIDINECTNSNGGCQSLCINTPGSYSCQCAPGYQPSAADVTVCVDIDECATGVSYCGQTCTNSPGSYTCSCDMGYVLYTANGTSGYNIPPSETGTHPGDTYYLNHTCVAVSCPPLSSPVNGNLMTTRRNLRVNETAYFLCSLGFTPVGNTSLTCQQDGTWTSAPPTCITATCPLPSTAGVAFPPISFTPSTSTVAYQSTVTLTCSTYLPSPVTLTRTCNYNKRTNSYDITQSGSISCPVVNCGPLEQGSGYLYTPLTSSQTTYYGAQYQLSCDNLFYMAGSSTSTSDPTYIECPASGQWTYGNITCVGVPCSDPGTPPGGFQWPELDYEVNKLVRFNCSRPGYFPNNMNPLMCMVSTSGTNVVWNSTIPSCVDMVRPVFASCPNSTVLVPTMQTPFSVGLTFPRVTDNSGATESSLGIRVTPPTFLPTQVINGSSVAVTYTATDFNNNVATCSFLVRTKNPVPPTIKCPNSTTAYLPSPNQTMFVYTVSQATASSNFSAVSITYNPPNIIADASMLGQFVVVTATATDTDGVTASCRFSVAIQAAPCSPWAIKTPPNTNMVCTSRPPPLTGYRCVVTCKSSAYKTQGGAPSYVSVCSTGGNWSQPFLGCITPVKAKYVIREETNYTYSSSSLIQPIAWNNNCSSLYDSQFKFAMTNVSTSLSAICSQAANTFVNVSIDLDSIMLFNDDPTLVTVFYDVYILPDNLTDVATSICGQIVSILFLAQGGQVSAMTYLYGGMSCADIYAPQGKGAPIRGSYTCPPGQQLSLSQDNNVCTACAPGTYADGLSNCIACPVGTYSDQQGLSACLPCPAGTYTYTTGAYNSSQCMQDCSSQRMVSATRMAPCFECPINTYATNSTTCVTCPAGTSTVTTGRWLQAQCLTQCAPGSFSQSGFWPSPTQSCSLCPVGYYQPNAQQKTCIECPLTTDFTLVGATSASDCKDGPTNLCANQPCVNGGTCTVSNHAFFCTCNPGYTGATCDVAIDWCEASPCFNGGTCTPVLGGSTAFTCRCPSGYGGSRCEMMPNACLGNTCQNGGQCQNLGTSYRCLCPLGFSGTFCEIVQSICVRSACQNGGTCVVLSSQRRQCTCPPGYSGQSCETNINECASNPCLFGGTCIDGVNMFTCSCVAGYTGVTCQTRPSPLCASTVCSSTGSCVDDYITPQQVCLCNAGYSSTNVGRNGTWWQSAFSVSGGQCAVTNYCASNPCINGGTCSSGALGYTCACPTGYGGLRCQEYLLTCTFQTCYNGGTCSGNPYTCTCAPGFGGRNCENVGNMCSPAPCVAGQYTSCTTLPSGMFQCNCKLGYTGTLCETQINNCLRNPCLHGGTCTNLVGAYTCSCTAGWTGPTCDSILDLCETNPCQNGATCFTLFNDYLCKCITPFHAKNCNESQNLCDYTQPCVGPNSTCTQQASKTTCQCAPGYIGDGCEIAIDFCNRMNPICANGAVCSPLWENYACTCPTDYVDQRCAYSPNYCTPSTCTAPGVCVSGYQGAYCDCPIGLTGSACTKAVDLNYDLYFYINSNAAVAMQPYLFKLNSTEFSVGIWLRFDSMSTSGTFFSLFGARYRAINTDMFPLLTVAADHAIISFGGSIVNLSFNPFQIYNHRWYFLTITWSSATSLVDFRINGVRIASLPNYGFGYTLPPFGYIALGSQFDTEKKIGIPGTGFAGWLSQVNVWSRSLTLNEILSLSLQASASGTLNSGKVVQWQNYLLGLGVKVVRPSTAGQSVCRDPMMTGYPTCTTPLPDRVAPSILCPSNIITTSSTRLTQVTWPAPNVTGTNLAPTSIFSNGNVFIWGRYTNTYVAADAAGNVALCDFDIFVQVDQCPDVSASVNNAPVCDGYGDNFKTCTPGCNSGTALPRLSPEFYTCGPEGKFNGFNYFLPFQTPSCGTVQQGSMTLQINVTYPASQFCDTYTSINAYSKYIGLRCDARWDALWGASPGTTKGFSKGAGCTALLANQITEVCITPGGNIAGGIAQGRKKRQATLSPFITINIPNLPMLLYSSSGQYPSLTPYEVILSDILDTQGLDFDSAGIPGAFAVQDSISLAIVVVCNVGQTSIDGTCVSCPPGTFYNATSLTCDYCPIGTYQDQSQQTSCVPCTSGTTTALVGMTSSSSCYTICPAGNQVTSPDSSGTCKLCDIGFYQNLTGQAFCWPCAADQTTANTGSTSSSVCFAVCPSGTQLAAVGGTCQNCSIGYYRTLGLQDSCVQCRTGWVTPTVRSVSDVACTVRNCTAGTYIDTTQTPYECTPCPIGQYQPMDYQYSCNQCPASQSTVNTGSKSLSSCQYYCPIGQEAANPLQPSVCTNCSIGYYKDNTVPGARCTICDDPTLITVSTGSTSLADCIIANCSAGSYLDTVNNVCVLCADGSYQPRKWQTSCIQCPPQTSTGFLGAISLSQCTVYCSAGYESVNQVCAPCKIGYYKNAGGPGPCDQCFTDYITPTNASTDISQCSVANSPPGSYRVTNVIPEIYLPCDYNTYQPNYAQLSCLQCPNDALGQPLVTLTMNTSALSGCVTNCPSGQQYNTATGSCVDCPRGYFRTQNNIPYEPVCVMCDPSVITPDVRSFTQDQCTVGNCTAGQKINGASCDECPIGQYQPNKWQTSCIPCPTGQTTLTISSTSASQCLFSCTGANACLNGGTCYQANNTGEPTCSCTPAYTGTHCETSISGFDWLPVIIGASIGGAILLLLLILLLVCILYRRRRKEKKQPTVVIPATGPAAGYLTTTTGFGEKTPNVINSVAANTVTRANPSLAVFGNTHSSANSYAFYEDSDDIPVLAGMKDVTSMRYNNVQSTAYNNRAYEVGDGFESKAQSMNFT